MFVVVTSTRFRTPCFSTWPLVVHSAAYSKVDAPWIVAHIQCTCPLQEKTSYKHAPGIFILSHNAKMDWSVVFTGLPGRRPNLMLDARCCEWLGPPTPTFLVELGRSDCRDDAEVDVVHQQNFHEDEWSLGDERHCRQQFRNIVHWEDLCFPDAWRSTSFLDLLSGCGRLRLGIPECVGCRGSQIWHAFSSWLPSNKLTFDRSKDQWVNDSWSRQSHRHGSRWYVYENFHSHHAKPELLRNQFWKLGPTKQLNFWTPRLWFPFLFLFPLPTDTTVQSVGLFCQELVAGHFSEQILQEVPVNRPSATGAPKITSAVRWVFWVCNQAGGVRVPCGPRQTY